jgi:hypothetical protein
MRPKSHIPAAAQTMVVNFENPVFCATTIPMTKKIGS